MRAIYNINKLFRVIIIYIIFYNCLFKIEIVQAHVEVTAQKLNNDFDSFLKKFKMNSLDAQVRSSIAEQYLTVARQNNTLSEQNNALKRQLKLAKKELDFYRAQVQVLKQIIEIQKTQELKLQNSSNNITPSPAVSSVHEGISTSQKSTSEKVHESLNHKTRQLAHSRRLYEKDQYIKALEGELFRVKAKFSQEDYHRVGTLNGVFYETNEQRSSRLLNDDPTAVKDAKDAEVLRRLNETVDNAQKELVRITQAAQNEKRQLLARNTELEKNLNTAINLTQSHTSEIEQLRKRLSERAQSGNNPQSLETSQVVQELEAQVKALEAQVIQLSGGQAESVAAGFTSVWLPLSSPSFIHLDNLKSEPNVPDTLLKEKLKEFQDAFGTVKVEGKDKLKLGPLRNLVSNLEPEDISTFEVVRRRKADFLSVENVKIACETLLESTIKLYDKYTSDRSQVPAGLTEYIAYQNQLQDIVAKINDIISTYTQKNFIEFMKKFNDNKQLLIEEIKKIMCKPGIDCNPYHKVINLIEFDLSSHTLSEFTRAFADPPSNVNDPNYYKLPFTIMNRLASGSRKAFDLQRFTTTIAYSTKTEIAGLDQEDPFAILRKSTQTTGSYNITIVENMYLMQFFNKRWNDIRARFEGIITDVQTCNVPILTGNAKSIISSVMQKPDFLEKKLHVHITTVRDLNEHLKPALESEHEKTWVGKGKQELRRDLIEFYQTYTSLVKTGSYLNSRNPRIDEYHE